jgi:predicted ATP-binding protein involved in virulence
MRLRHLRIRIQTSNGPYGTDIPFPDGMVVIWADNSMGKSTCVKSCQRALKTSQRGALENQPF